VVVDQLPCRLGSGYSCSIHLYTPNWGGQQYLNIYCREMGAGISVTRAGVIMLAGAVQNRCGIQS